MFTAWKHKGFFAKWKICDKKVQMFDHEIEACSQSVGWVVCPIEKLESCRQGEYQITPEIDDGLEPTFFVTCADEYTARLFENDFRAKCWFRFKILSAHTNRSCQTGAQISAKYPNLWEKYTMRTYSNATKSIQCAINHSSWSLPTWNARKYLYSHSIRFGSTMYPRPPACRQFPQWLWQMIS